MKSKAAAILILGLQMHFFSGCTSLQAELPASRFESPETNGVEHRFMISGSVSQSHNDTFTTDASQRPPNLTRPSIDRDVTVGVSTSMGVIENFDVGLRTTTGPSPFVVVGKYQLIGPTGVAAKEGDDSIAVTFSAGAGSRSRSGDQNRLFGPGGYEWTGTIRNTMTDAALIFGHRVTDRLLIYGGPFYANYDISVAIDQKASSDGSSPAASYSINTSGYQKGVNVAAQLGGEHGYVTIEGIFSEAHASGLNNSILQVGGAAGARF